MKQIVIEVGKQYRGPIKVNPLENLADKEWVLVVEGTEHGSRRGFYFSLPKKYLEQTTQNS